MGNFYRNRGGCAMRRSLDNIYRLIFAEYPAHRIRNLAQRAPRAHRIDNSRHQVGIAARDGLDLRQRGVGGGSIALGAILRELGLLLLLEGGIPLERLARRRAALGELVHAHDDAIPGFDLALVKERRVLNFALHVSALDRGDRTAEVIDLREILLR